MSLLNRLRKGALIALSFLWSGLGLYAQQADINRPLTPWEEGYLDIHLINTGKGESTFFILPDGTTMIVDAGEALSKKPWAPDPKPDDSKRPGEWIARYILKMTAHLPEQKLNYMMLSHFHWDHMGGFSSEMETAHSGAYHLTGITTVGDMIPFEKMIDRNWPDYNWPVPLDDDKMENYKNFLNWQMQHNDVVVEQYEPGRNDQIVLINDPEGYPDFEIRNIAVNGHVWTGVGSITRNHFPELKDLDKSNYPTENKSSIAFRLSYGRFDYFTAGDIDVRDVEVAGPFNQWKDIERPIAMATGPVEVLKANHHANYDANSPFFLGVLRPRVITIASWGASQPAMNIYRSMISKQTYPGPREIFATNIMEETRTSFNVDKIKGQQGHVVIRVLPGGESFMVYMLDDTSEEFIVKSVNGPYFSN